MGVTACPNKHEVLSEISDSRDTWPASARNTACKWAQASAKMQVRMVCEGRSLALRFSCLGSRDSKRAGGTDVIPRMARSGRRRAGQPIAPCASPTRTAMVPRRMLSTSRTAIGPTRMLDISRPAMALEATYFFALPLMMRNALLKSSSGISSFSLWMPAARNSLVSATKYERVAESSALDNK